MEERGRKSKLHRDEHLDTSGTQWLQPSKPVFHRCRPQLEGGNQTSLLTSRCELLPLYCGALHSIQGIIFYSFVDENVADLELH